MTNSAPTQHLSVRNEQRETLSVPTRYLKKVWKSVWSSFLGSDCLGKIPSGFEIAVCLVSSSRMARINKEFLNHTGPTDIITFDYPENDWAEASQADKGWIVRGDLIICPLVAVQQSREFNVHWIEELVRYGIHGWLHLLGYDDQDEDSRRIMKRVENATTQQAVNDFPIPEI